MPIIIYCLFLFLSSFLNLQFPGVLSPWHCKFLQVWSWLSILLCLVCQGVTCFSVAFLDLAWRHGMAYIGVVCLAYWKNNIQLLTLAAQDWLFTAYCLIKGCIPSVIVKQYKLFWLNVWLKICGYYGQILFPDWPLHKWLLLWSCLPSHLSSLKVI